MGRRRWTRRAAAAIWAAGWAASVAGDAVPPPPPPPPAPAPAPAAAGEPWLGLLLGDAVDGGVQIVAVVPDGPADRAGMRDGDLVIRVNGTDVADRNALRRAVNGVRVGDKLVVSLLRGGEPRDVTLTTGTRTGDAGFGPPGLFVERRAPLAHDMDLGSMPGAETWIDPELARRAEATSGVTLADIPRELRLHYGAPGNAGLLVARVEAKGPAAAAGLRVGDVLVRAGGASLDGTTAYAAAVLRARPGAPLAVEGTRAGKAFSVRIVLPEPATPPELRGLSRERRMQRLEAMIESTRRRLEELQRQLELEEMRETP